MLRINESEQVQSRIRVEVKALGANATAKRLGVSRAALLGYLAGTARNGTIALVESRVGRLDVTAS